MEQMLAKDETRRERRAQKQRRWREEKELAHRTEIWIERGYGARY
jgi:hypothetical protein